ncbi:MAG: radical SAM protein [Candidatus Hadarchaeaceae archaeon]|nr:B12-binding domain-containing radical SAM protein [Hadesarchaea archaeon]MDH5684928.1 B12-binding domain-containing radical SAM protein [Hadesarchaea archaeon]
MKVVLINPNTGRAERIENEAAWPPLGLLYLGAVLKKSEHEVKVIDNARIQLPVEKIVERVKRENPGVLGVSTLTPTFKQGIKIASAIKAELPDLKIILGNYHATFTYKRLLTKYPFVDYVVLGEGEQIFLELVNALEKNEGTKKIKGIAFRHDGRVVKTPPRQFIQNLDELPLPDRTLLEQEYHSEVVGMLGSSGKFTTVLTSRGCPYNCRYCACSAFSLRKARFRSPEAVVAEMGLLQMEGYEEVGFVDDNLLLDQHRMEKICDLLKENGIKLTLWAEGRVDQASREVLRKFARVGCKTIYFGVESGNQKVLNYYGKNISPELSRKAMRNCKDAGIENIIGSFIVGAPIETREDVQRTLDFALNLRGMDFPQMNVLMLSPGMDLWDTAVREGHLDEEKYWEDAVTAINVFPSHLKEEELSRMIDRFYSKFIKRPTFWIPQILKTVQSKYRMKILLANLKSRTSFRETVRQLTGG